MLRTSCMVPSPLCSRLRDFGIYPCKNQCFRASDAFCAIHLSSIFNDSLSACSFSAYAAYFVYMLLSRSIKVRYFVYIGSSFLCICCVLRACLHFVRYVRHIHVSGLCRPLAAGGGLWRSLAASGGLWPLLAASGELWRALAASGGLRRPLAVSGGLSRFLAASGGLWRCLAASGGLWRPLAGIWRPLAAFGFRVSSGTRYFIGGSR